MLWKRWTCEYLPCSKNVRNGTKGKETLVIAFTSQLGSWCVSAKREILNGRIKIKSGYIVASCETRSRLGTSNLHAFHAFRLGVLFKFYVNGGSHLENCSENVVLFAKKEYSFVNLRNLRHLSHLLFVIIIILVISLEINVDRICSFELSHSQNSL